MITESSVQSAGGLAIDLAQKGYKVVAKPNTPLFSLVQVTLASKEIYSDCIATDVGTNLLQDNDISKTINNQACLLNDLTKDKESTASEHTLTLAQYADQISAALAQHISFARSTVKPLVIEYQDKVREVLSSFGSTSTLNDWLVVVKDVPEICESPVFVDELGYYKDKAIVKPGSRFTFAPKQYGAIVESFLTADESVDEAIQAWVSNKSPEDITAAWNGFFSNEGIALNPDDIIGFDVFTQIDTALVIYLYARRAFDEVETGYTLTNLDSYRNLMAEIRDYAGAVISSALSRIYFYQKTDTIVLTTDQVKQTVTVYGDRYRAWLSEGGTPEILFGMVVKNITANTRADISEKSEIFNQAWITHFSFKKASEQNNDLDTLKQVLVKVFNDLIPEVAEGEKEWLESHPDHLNTVDKRLYSELDDLRIQDLNDVNRVCLKIMCRARFYYTDSYEILGGISDAMDANPNLDVREAATLAALNLTGQWLADQMVLEI